MAQWVKCLPHKCENLGPNSTSSRLGSTGPQPQGSQGKMGVGGKDRGTPRQFSNSYRKETALLQSVLNKLASFFFLIPF